MTELQTEVVIVGSGAGGAVTAARLAEAGLDVVVIEEGPEIPPTEQVAFSEAEMVSKYRHSGVNAMLGLPPIAYVEGRCVGGGTEINSGLYHRPPPAIVADWRRRYNIADLDTDELYRHAEQVEKELSVSPLPGVAPDSSQILDRGARSLGWDVREVPRVFRYSDGDPSWRNGVKQTMSRSYLPRARAAGAHVISGCHAGRILRDGTRVTGVECRREVGGRAPAASGEMEPLTIRAEHVFVCAGTIQSPVLLQRSGIRRNIGKHFKAHPTIKLAARFDRALDDHGFVPMHQVKEFAPDFTFGGSISRPGYIALALGDHWEGNARDLEDWERIGVYYAAIRSDGAGRIRAIPGLPNPVVSYWLTNADLSRLARSIVHLGELLFAAGADRLYPGVTGMRSLDSPRGLVELWDAVSRPRANLMTIHLFSSIGMGERPEVTGADSHGRIRGYDNLYVNDASLLPDAPGVNPQGSIMAVASRNCEHFLHTR